MCDFGDVCKADKNNDYFKYIYILYTIHIQNVLSKHLFTNELSVPSANDIDLNTKYTINNIFSLNISFNSG